jgi:hypothetical protein
MMMDLHVIPRTLIDRWIRTARLPVDVAVSLIEGSDPVGPAHIAVDETDASARELLGRLTGDGDLLAEASQKRAAANKRRDALRLRREAADDQGKAVETIHSGRRRADARRQQAEKTAEAREAVAEKVAEQELHRVDEQVRKERSAVRNADKAASERRIKQERNAKLQTLEDKESALSEKEQALTTREEAERLEEAAASIKAERKAR